MSQKKIYYVASSDSIELIDLRYEEDIVDIITEKIITSQVDLREDTLIDLILDYLLDLKPSFISENSLETEVIEYITSENDFKEVETYLMTKDMLIEYLESKGLLILLSKIKKEISNQEIAYWYSMKYEDRDEITPGITFEDLYELLITEDFNLYDLLGCDYEDLITDLIDILVIIYDNISRKLITTLLMKKALVTF